MSLYHTPFSRGISQRRRFFRAAKKISLVNPHIPLPTPCPLLPPIGTETSRKADSCLRPVFVLSSSCLRPVFVLSSSCLRPVFVLDASWVAKPEEMRRIPQESKREERIGRTRQDRHQRFSLAVAAHKSPNDPIHLAWMVKEVEKLERKKARIGPIQLGWMVNQVVQLCVSFAAKPCNLLHPRDKHVGAVFLHIGLVSHPALFTIRASRTGPRCA